MQVYEAILKRRSIRNFQARRIPPAIIRSMVNAARLAPSAANMQPLEFLVVTKKAICKEVFKNLRWAGYIAPHGNPRPGCEPVAYIIIVINRQVIANLMPKKRVTTNSFKEGLRDIGAAAENIMLFAQSKGIASCWLGAIDKDGIRRIFKIPPALEVDSVIALGYPKAKSKITDFKGSIKYYLDKKGVLNVPKRLLQEILHINSY